MKASITTVRVKTFIKLHLFAPLIILFFVCQAVSGKQNPASEKKQTTIRKKSLVAGCSSSQAITSLDISNVRTIILMSGDMWWDAVTLNNVAQYEVPKGTGKTSLFAGAIWLGGLDTDSNLYVAAQTYRQTGIDFFPGPIDTTTTTIDSNTCVAFDRHFKLTRQEVLDFIAGNPATQAMLDYPGNGTGAQAHFLAPFFDNNNDGIYNTADGDYPRFDYMGSTGADCFNALHGDQCLWFVINDVGNIHTETSSANKFGIEIHAQAFAYLSSDADIDNSTFYQYQMINRSSNTYHQTYFGAWVDFDLGNANDDYTGCDVMRGMGYGYNSDNDDEGSQGYGINPPAVGMDILHGPLADAFDGIDNDRDSTIDEPGERIMISGFRYYNNDFSHLGNPSSAADYYNFLLNRYLDGNHILFGGNGDGIGPCSTTVPANFMFPGDSDPYGWGTNGVVTQASNPACWNWTELAAADASGDRRFVMPAGPFSLLPGGVQSVTTSAIWARALTAGPLGSLDKLKAADDKIQAFADNCFDITPYTSSVDAGAVNIFYPKDSTCDSTFSPVVSLVNFGTTVLTSALINYRLDANPVQNYLWYGSLNRFDTALVSLPVMSASAGNHSLTIYSALPNNSPDQNHSNDSSITYFLINTGMPLPLTEGFEAIPFPPPTWTRTYGSHFINIGRYSLASGFGNSTACLRASCYSTSLYNRMTDFTSSNLDVRGLTAPSTLTFSVAYAQRSDSSADTLQVLISEDCGATFNIAYSKTGTALATAPDTSIIFVPTVTQWRSETINLAPYLMYNHVKVRFRFLTGDTAHPGNNMYVDDINIIGTPIGIKELQSGNSVRIYPNPATSNFTVQVNPMLCPSQLYIYNVTGQEIMSMTLLKPECIINTRDYLPGIYFVRIRTVSGEIIKKLVIE